MNHQEYRNLVEFLGRQFEAIDRRFDTVDERFREVLRHFDELYRRLERPEQEYHAIVPRSGGSRACWQTSGVGESSSSEVSRS